VDFQNFGAYWLAMLLIGTGGVLVLAALRLRLRAKAAIFAPPDSRRPPPCVIRLLEANDIDACEAIYRLNEARFPPDMFDRFSQVLRGKGALFLVAESNHQVVAFGGILMRRTDKTEMANLVFGMVHPSFRKHGYGTALLRARLAMLPLARRGWFVALTVTGGSETFYSRFGFKYLRPVPIGSGRMLDEYYVVVTARAQKRCAKALANILAPAPFGSTYVPGPALAPSSQAA
jgi:predicted N-acetyltransferase YhbS